MDRTALTNAVRRQTNLTTSDVSDADVFAVLNEGINDVSSLTRWPFLYKSATISVTASTVEASLPADFRMMGTVMVDGKRNSPLIQISHDEYLYRFGDNATSQADGRYFYLRFDDGTESIGFYPTPAATESDHYDIYYYRSPTELSGSSDEPEWDSQFHPILVDYAAYRLWEREEYFEEAQSAFQRYVRRFADMVRYYNMRNHTNRLIVGDGAYFGGAWNPRKHLPFL